jgi:hypothetical protein
MMKVGAEMDYRSYQNYLLSAQWRAHREHRLESAGHRCEYMVDQWPDRPGKTWSERCDATDALEVHHLHYGSLGAEADGDLEVLCRFHHLLTHMMGVTCKISGECVYDHEQDAIFDLECAVERMGGIENVTIDDIDIPAHDPYVQHLLDKD